MAELIKFRGTCAVCGEQIEHEWNSNHGMIDYKITDDNKMVTWIRHYGTAPAGANPDCEVYSSEVTEVERHEVPDEPQPAMIFCCGFESGIM